MDQDAVAPLYRRESGEVSLLIAHHNGAMKVCVRYLQFKRGVCLFVWRLSDYEYGGPRGAPSQLIRIDRVRAIFKLISPKLDSRHLVFLSAATESERLRNYFGACLTLVNLRCNLYSVVVAIMDLDLL